MVDNEIRITVQFFPDEGKVWISEEDSSGAEYSVTSKEELIAAFSKYVDYYVM